MQRGFFAVIAAALFGIASVTFYQYISLPTDENWFGDGPTRILVSRNIKADLTGSYPYRGTSILYAKTSTDSIRVGDLVLKINDGLPKTIKDVYGVIGSGPAASRIVVLRPSANRVFEFTVRRSDIRDGSFTWLPSYAYVFEVIPNGASDRAGMKVGDLIVRINEKDFSSANEADRILRLGQIGKSLKYDVIRNNEYVTLQVVLSQYGVPFAILIFALSGFVFMLAGAFILLSRPTIVSARLTGSAFLLLGFAIAMLVVRRDFFSSGWTVARNILVTASMLMGVSLSFHSRHYFPLETPALIAKRWLTRSYYIVVAAIGALAVLTDTQLYLMLIPVYGTVVFFLTRKKTSVEYRRLNTVIKWTSLGVFAASAAGYFLFIDSTTAGSLGVIGAAITAIPIAYLYTIGRYRLLDMNFKVRRNMQYSVITTVWNLALIAALVWCFFTIPQLNLPTGNIIITGASIEITDLPPDLSANNIPVSRVLVMALGLAMVYAFITVRRFGQRIIDTKYFRLRYDYRQASEELGDLLATTLTLDGLAGGLAVRLGEIMKLKRVGTVFFRDEAACSSAATFGFDAAWWKGACTQHQQQFIAAVRQFNHESRVEYLPSPMKEEFQEQGLQYLVPIRSKNTLLGAIVVGEKQAETTYQQEDLAFLSSVSKQAAVSIENAFLYEQLAEKERMKHELEIARRIQLESLPQSTPNVPGLDIAGTSLPAMEVGGDFYDYLTNTREKLTIIIGDVSGKGTSAALYMSRVQGILRSLHGFDLSPKELFHRANTLLCQDLEKRSFVTVLGAEFDTERRCMSVARAGHLPLLHYHASVNTVEKVIPRGLGLGLNDKGVFIAEMEQREVSYAAGDIFLFATDGVTEAHNTASDFGEDRLLDLLQHHASLSAHEIQEIILNEVRTFTGTHPQHDDQTIVIVKSK